jgi:hypothetical protein
VKNKIVFWVENKPNQTFSYIYAGMKKAFERLGCEIHWFSDQSFPSQSEFDYSNCIFFVDNQGPLDHNVPIVDTGIYFAYDKFTNINKYLDKVRCLVNYRVAEFKKPILDDDRYVEVEKGVIFDTQASEPYNVVYFSWATNLMPEEIDLDWVNKERNNEYNFVGTIHAPRPNVEPLHQQFIEIVKNKGISFNHYNPNVNPATDEEHVGILQRSMFVPDFRPQEQKDNWYLPCRVLKAISYGCLAVSDAPYLKNFIDDSILTSENAQEIFDLGMKNKNNKELILHQMEIVKRDHTYLNRCRGILKIVEQVRGQ